MLKRSALVVVLLGWSSSANAQVANPTAILFNSPDHTAVIPGGSQPVVAGYQGLLFASTADPSTGTPIVVGTRVLKTVVTTVGVGDYQLTFAQMGLTIPTCAAAPCPQYRALIVADGPTGFSDRRVTDVTPPFTATVPVPARPASPTNLRLN